MSQKAEFLNLYKLIHFLFNKISKKKIFLKLLRIYLDE